MSTDASSSSTSNDDAPATASSSSSSTTEAAAAAAANTTASKATTTTTTTTAATTLPLNYYYFLHGVQYVLPGLATGQVLMDVLHVQEPSEMSLVYSMLWLPWTLKPIFGYLSDHYPLSMPTIKTTLWGFIFGASKRDEDAAAAAAAAADVEFDKHKYRRTPYLTIGICLNASLWFVLYALLEFSAAAAKAQTSSQLQQDSTDATERGAATMFSSPPSLTSSSWLFVLHHGNRQVFYILLFCCYCGFCLAETMVDAIMAEVARDYETYKDTDKSSSSSSPLDEYDSDNDNDSGKIQSGAWTLDAAGTVLSTLAVTLAFGVNGDDENGSTTSSCHIFLACGVLATLQLLIVPALFRQEQRMVLMQHQQQQKQQSQAQPNTPHHAQVPSRLSVQENSDDGNSLLQRLVAKEELNSDDSPPKCQDHAVHPQETTPAGNAIDPDQTQQDSTQSSLNVIPSLSKALLTADQRLLRCLGFVFLLSASPTSGDAFFYYQRDRLNFSLTFLAMMGVARTLLNLAASFCYYKWWRKLEYRVVFRNAILLAFVVGMANVVVVQGWNHRLGIPNHAFVLGDTVVQGIAGEIVFMPVAVLAAKLAPPGLEGTIYATTMAVTNLSWMLSSLLSGMMSSMLGITAGNYDNMTTLLVLVNCLTLLPLCFLHWVPTSMTVTSTTTTTTTTDEEEEGEDDDEEEDGEEEEEEDIQNEQDALVSSK